MPLARLERTRQAYAVTDPRRPSPVFSFEDAVACIRRNYGDNVADYWAKDNADNWNVIEGETH